MLEVRLLGGLSAAVDGEPVTLPADARARELLARIALSPGLQPRSALAGRLRPDVPEESARKTLRSALYELRRALGPAGAAALVADGRQIGLAEDEVRVDVREFRRNLEAGELEAAVSAGEGGLLEGLDSDWALRARDEHEVELAGVLGTLSERARDRGDLSAAVGWARRRVGLEPLSEAAHRELITLLALAGDRPAALTAAEAMTERLRRELGVPASAASRTLVEDVRRGRVAAEATASPAMPPPELPAALARGRRPEGREPELERLREVWSEALAGATRFALVAGEPGIGKTTLASELGRRAHAEGALVLLGRSDDQALVPFQPWVEVLEGLLDGLSNEATDRWLSAYDGALARLLPARSAVDAPPAGPRERYLAFELVRELLDEVAARSPVLLVLDDVHWADTDSLTLLRHLARSTRAARLLVLLCARTAELAPTTGQVLAELRREGPLVHVDLAGLDDDAVGALLAEHTGSADREVARRYRARSGGNPFFLDELLRAEREAGPGSDEVPAGVREVIAQRLERLDGETMLVLELAAVAGLEFDVHTLAGAGERPVAEVLRALDDATRTALVKVNEPARRYAFAHALVVETILAAQPPSRRAQLHLQLAGVLADGHEDGTVGAGEVARHLRAAGALVDAERRASWELAAAREATAALAHADAAGHYEAALAAAGGRRDPELLLALGRSHDRAGRRAEARAAFLDAAELARSAGDSVLLAQASLGYGGMAVVITAADSTAVDLLEEALAALPDDAPGTSARLLAKLSVELYYADPGRARELGARAVEQARRAGEPAALAAALNAHRVALWAPQHAGERLEVAGEMVAAAEAAGDQEAVLQGRNWRVVDLIELGRLGDAEVEIDAYEVLADATGLPHFRWYVPLWRGALAILAGRWEEATALSARARALGRQADDANAPMFADIQREQNLFAQGRYDEVDRDRLMHGAVSSPAATEWLVWVALLDASTGAPDEARRIVTDLTRDGSSAIAMNANWHGACVLAEAAAQVGDREAAALLHTVLEPHAHLFPLLARAAACLGSAEYFVGRLAWTLGRHEEAEARLRRAVSANDEAGAASRAAVAQLSLGELLADRGDRSGARDALEQAAARAEALGMPAVAARALTRAPR